MRTSVSLASAGTSSTSKLKKKIAEMPNAEVLSVPSPRRRAALVADVDEILKSFL